MICAELELLEAQLDELITAMERDDLPDEERRKLEDEYTRVVHLIRDHQLAGHSGKPCFESDAIA